MSSKKVIIASAGSRKTTSLVDQALASPSLRTIITTYTIENSQQVSDFFFERVSCIPKTIQVLTWYSFLLRECVRPYQNVLYDKKRIRNIFFSEGRSTLFTRKADVSRYYLFGGEDIYTDKISEFACRCNELSRGLMISRLEQMYDQIFIDESQDLAGYDFDLLELLFRSNISLLVVGDCRQSTYFTNCSPKHKAFKGYNIIQLFASWHERGLCQVEQWNQSFRCNQAVCDFADKLYPELDPTLSQNHIETGHDGIFLVKPKDVADYFGRFKPTVLRDSVRTDSKGFHAMNFGIAKGRTFDRVLIFPNGPIHEYLKNADPSALKPRTKAGLYVAVTRARHSVAFVADLANPSLNVHHFT
jgi:DNA helicase II / ATP-dependent DNA helicase PcrA